MRFLCNSWLYLLCGLLFAQVAESPEAVFQRLRSRIAIVPLAGERESIAGKYTSTPQELASYWGGGGFLSGEDLHLFPDGTYIYCEWADIEALTIYDKGTWLVAGLTIELTSDSEVTWGLGRGCSKLQRHYLLLHRAGRKRDALLMGLGCALSGFEKDSKDDPGFMLLVNGLLRTEVYNRPKAEKMRTLLMKTAWHPEQFKQTH
ncbi:MAG: hypothetical protein ABSG25_07225 [Bryobacteraceae bacterium]